MATLYTHFRKFHYGFISLSVMFFIGILPTLAQEDTSQDFCATFMEIQQTVSDICDNMADESVCIANQSVEAYLNDSALSFGQLGDTLPIGEFDTLTASPLAPNSGMWGIAVFSVHADLPAESDEQVQIVLYGGVELTIPPINEIPEGYGAPMQAFNIHATHETACSGMPPGVLINVPEGQVANFLVNGLKIHADNQIFIGLPADNSYLSVSRYGVSTGQIVWADNNVTLGDNVAVVLVPMASLTPNVMMTPGGAIATVTQEPSYNTRGEPELVYVAVGAVEGQENTIFLQWEVLNAPDNLVEFVVDGKAEWELAPATSFYQVVQISPTATAINLVIRISTSSGYVYRGIDFPLPITEILFSYIGG